MNVENLVKISDQLSQEVCQRFELSEDGAPLFEENLEPEAFLRRLIESECWADATQFLAHALPKREAVWWGILATRDQLQGGGPPEAAALLEAAERWVRQPTDENRRAAMPPDDADLGQPASMVGIAAFMGGGSITPPNVEDVPPPVHLTGTMVASAVILTAVSPDPLEAPAKYRVFLARGVEIARGPET